MYSRQSTCHQVRLLVSHTEHQTPTGAHASSKGNGGFAACVLAELSAPCLAPSVWAQDGTVEKTVGIPILPGLLLLPGSNKYTMLGDLLRRPNLRGPCSYPPVLESMQED